jgi:hypothetical protein
MKKGRKLQKTLKFEGFLVQMMNDECFGINFNVFMMFHLVLAFFQMFS